MKQGPDADDEADEPKPRRALALGFPALPDRADCCGAIGTRCSLSLDRGRCLSAMSLAGRSPTDWGAPE